MSVYKELDSMVGLVSEQSKQIYPDACDYGVLVFSNNDEIINSLKAIIDQYKTKVETSRYGTGSTQTIRIQGMNECGNKRGEKYTVIFTYVFVKEQYRKGLSGAIGFLSVDVDDSKFQKF